MQLLFVHQNFPGQYLHLAPYMARAGHGVIALSNRKGITINGVRIINYQMPAERAPGTHRHLSKTEECAIRGERVAALALRLAASGFRPDVVCAHPGWGEALYIDDVWPGVPQLHYCEFYFAPFAGAAQFSPSEPVSVDSIFELRVRNTINLLSLASCRAGVTPTHWQWSQFPARHRARIAVLHEGVSVKLFRPDPAAAVVLPDGRHLRTGDPVVTFVSRNLEPTRGFPEFMRAASKLLQRRPDVEVIVVGGDGISYGPPPQPGGSWRDQMLREVDVDPSRMHFLGKLPYGEYLKVLQVSAVHVYLTVPFVLSWSLIEAMAAGCLVVGSDTAPVRELIVDGHNGLLVNFFDTDSLARRIEEALNGGPAFDAIRNAARQTVCDGYSLARCLPQQAALIEHVAQLG